MLDKSQYDPDKYRAEIAPEDTLEIRDTIPVTLNSEGGWTVAPIAESTHHLQLLINQYFLPHITNILYELEMWKRTAEADLDSNGRQNHKVVSGIGLFMLFHPFLNPSFRTMGNEFFDIDCPSANAVASVESIEKRIYLLCGVVSIEHYPSDDLNWGDTFFIYQQVMIAVKGSVLLDLVGEDVVKHLPIQGNLVPCVKTKDLKDAVQRLLT